MQDSRFLLLSFIVETSEMQSSNKLTSKAPLKKHRCNLTGKNEKKKKHYIKKNLNRFGLEKNLTRPLCFQRLRLWNFTRKSNQWRMRFHPSRRRMPTALQVTNQAWQFWGRIIYTDLKTDDSFMFNLLICWLLTVSELQNKLDQSKSQLQDSKLQLEREGTKSYNLSKKSS